MHSSSVGKLVRYAILDGDETIRDLENAGYVVLRFGVEGVGDTSTFFDAARAAFPLDPPVMSSNNWDALSDSLWEGLFRSSSSRIAIVWLNAAVMAHAAPHEFAIALEVFADLARSLGDPEMTAGSPKQVTVVVADEVRPRPTS
jgi:Barstar (barnase inhibitor)